MVCEVFACDKACVYYTLGSCVLGMEVNLAAAAFVHLCVFVCVFICGKTRDAARMLY